MKEVIICKAAPEAKKEMRELYQNKGCSLIFADTVKELMMLLEKEGTSTAKVKIYMHNLSDISLLSIISSYDRAIDLTIIVPPRLYQIIQQLRENNFKVVEESSYEHYGYIIDN